MIASSQSNVTVNACQPPERPLPRPGGGLGSAGFGTAFGPRTVMLMVPYAVSSFSAFCCASIDSRSDSSLLIWFWTLSRSPTDPAWPSSARSWLIAASSEVT
jgi:hypothetical protein